MSWLRSKRPAAERSPSLELHLESLEDRIALSTATLVKDIDPQQGGSLRNPARIPRNLTEFNGTLFFQADNRELGGELWRSDGTSDGTQVVKDINPGSPSSGPTAITNVNGTLFFEANDGVTGRELWKSDGTAAGTQLVKDIDPGTSLMSRPGGVGPIFFEGPSGSHPSNFLDLNGTLFFTATNETNGNELWTSDGTSEGTQLFKDINPGSDDGIESELLNVNGMLFFFANDGTNGTELWKSDGTPEGTQLVEDTQPGLASSSVQELEAVNGILFFSAGDVTNGFELWRSDGTEGGTLLLQDILPGSESSFPMSLENVNRTLFFSASNGINGRELWSSDGTPAGTRLVRDIQPGSEGSRPMELTNVNGTLFFSAADDADNRELWKSDGTSEGTQLLKDIRPGSEPSNPRDLTNIDGTLWFSAFDPNRGGELWKSDGTSEGTVLVDNINAGPASSSPDNFIGVNGQVFFVANDGVHGTELWTANPTEARLAVGADAGGAPLVEVYDAAGNLLFGFFAYDSSFAGGVRVATGDFDRDGVEDIITAAGAGGGPHVRIFSGVDGSLLTEFFAYDPAFVGGVFLAAGDIDNDGFLDIVTGAGAGGSPHVRAFSSAGKGTLADFFAFDPSFFGGVTVAVGDPDNDGFGDIIAGAGAGGTPHVRIFSGGGKGTLADFLAFDPSFSGGVFVASGDLNGNGFDDIIVGAGPGGGPHVRAFDGGGAGTLADFFAFNAAFNGGTRVTSLDRVGNVGDELVVGAGPGGGPNARTFAIDPFGQIDSFFALGGLFGGGLFVS